MKKIVITMMLLLFTGSVNAATISGTASYAVDPLYSEHSGYVAVYNITDLVTPVVTGMITPSSGDFSVTVPVETTPYIVFGFYDENDSVSYQPGEAYNVYTQPVYVTEDIDYFIETVEFEEPEVILSASSASGSVGDIITIDIEADEAMDIAGGAFTIAYDSDALSLVSVDTTFFDTFTNQWNGMNPVPDPVPPTSVDVDGTTYDQPAVMNSMTGYVMLAAARVEPPGISGGRVLVSLTFEITASSGEYPVSILHSLIDNTSAGYSAGGELIPMLTGSTNDSDLSLAFPEIHAATVGGTVSVGVSCSEDWEVYDNDPEGATISSVQDDVFDETLCVTEFSGDGTANGYRTYNPDPGSSDRVIEWKMKYSQDFTVYVDVQTTYGHRYMYYKPIEDDLLGSGEYVHYGLGTSAKDGQWTLVKRNLAADLAHAQPGNVITEVRAFLIRGSGRICDVALSSDGFWVDSDRDGLADGEESTYETDPYESDTDNDGIDDLAEIDYWYENGGWSSDIDGDGLTNIIDPDSDGDGIADGLEIELGLDPATPDAEMVYEDGENGTGNWIVYDDDPAGANVSIQDLTAETHGSNVIELSGTGTQNGYKLTKDDGSDWENTLLFNLQWDMNYSEYYVVYIDLETNFGHRFMMYKPTDNNLYGDEAYVHFGLGADSYNGEWMTFKRNLAADLEYAQPGNSIIAVNGFYIRGSGQVDNIILTSDASDIDSDRDGLLDSEETALGTNPYDSDSDDDGASDGDEIANGTDPVWPDVTEIIYEDGSGDASKWIVYDNDPENATVSVVEGAIQLSGAGTPNGYQLLTEYGGKWANTQMTVIQWSLNYSEYFVVYVDVETIYGHRYMTYRPNNNSPTLSVQYINWGVGSDSINGTWQTFTRDLQADISELEPGNILNEVNGFLIRGSGLVDDIKLMETMPQ